MHRPARLRDLRQSKSSSGSSRCALTSEHEVECEQQHLIPFNPAAGVQPRDRKGALHLDRLAAAGKREHAQCANAAAEAAHPAADGAVVRWDRRGVLRLLRIPVRDEVHPHPPHPPPPPRGEAAAGRPPPPSPPRAEITRGSAGTRRRRTSRRCARTGSRRARGRRRWSRGRSATCSSSAARYPRPPAPCPRAGRGDARASLRPWLPQQPLQLGVRDAACPISTG